MWEPGEKNQKFIRQIIRPERLEYYHDKVPKYFVINGQQGVTALASVMLKRGLLKEMEPELEEDLPPSLRTSGTSQKRLE